jgi:serine/threonine-protein kinase
VEGTQFGRYRLLQLLGRGGMGEVWRAYDATIDRVVALKVLPAEFADDEVFQERFRREARAAAGLDEPHVVPIHDFGEIDGRLYVTMRLIKGRDLQTVLAEGPLPPPRAVGIIEQIASALHAAHQVGLVHRDVKPSNILIGDEDFAYLIDFGIARAANETSLTSTGAVIGTWAYMPPERITTGRADARADIYALSCVLHEALTGQRPFPGDSLEQQIVGHLSTPPPQPSTLQAGVPSRLDNVITTGMAKEPDRRYATAKDLARAARAALTTPSRQPLPQRPRVTAPPPERFLGSPPRGGFYSGGAPAPPAPAADWRSNPHLQPTGGPASAASPPLQLKNRRTKLLLATVAAIVIVSVAVATIVFVSQSSTGGGVPSPTSTTSRTEATPSRTTTNTPGPDATQRLLALVPSGDNCTPDTGSSAGGAVAYVICKPGVSGITVLGYWLFSDAGRLYNHFGQGSLACPGTGQSTLDWRSTTDPQLSGKVECYRSGDTYFTAWTVDSQLLYGFVGGTSLEPVYQWWAARYKK